MPIITIQSIKILSFSIFEQYDTLMLINMKTWNMSYR